MEPQNMALIFFVWVILCKEGLDYKTRYLPWTRQKLTNSDPILVSDTFYDSSYVQLLNFLASEIYVSLLLTATAAIDSQCVVHRYSPSPSGVVQKIRGQ